MDAYSVVVDISADGAQEGADQFTKAASQVVQSSNTMTTTVTRNQAAMASSTKLLTEQQLQWASGQANLNTVAKQFGVTQQQLIPQLLAYQAAQKQNATVTAEANRRA